MARSDLLVSLVRASAAGDSKQLTSTVEAIIAEERAKQHNILADRLARALRSNGNGGQAGYVVAEPVARARDYVAKTSPKKRLEDLFLPEVCERACRELIEEQRRASLLRSHSLEHRHRVLLVGPPGNGKTSLAEAITEALAVQFFVVRYETIIGSFLGETASRLRRVFEYGTIAAGEANIHRIPLPHSLERVTEPRTLTVTVAWFSPVNRRHQAYRRAKLEVSAVRSLDAAAGVNRSSGQPSDKSVPRGTVWHASYDGDKAVAFVDDGHVVLRIYCREQAGALDQNIRYGVAVTIETGQGIAVYDEVRARLAVRVAAGVP